MVHKAIECHNSPHVKLTDWLKVTVMNSKALEYCTSGYENVVGFEVNGENLLAVNLLMNEQNNLGITGDAIEVGVFHGRTAMLLGLNLQKNEKFIGIDLFGAMGDVTHEDRQVDLDYYGDGKIIKNSFLNNWSNIVGNKEITVIEKDSRNVSSKELFSHTSGCRLFSLDGGHSEKSTYSDLALGESVLIDGGILVLDDYFLEDCPAVSVGAVRYFLENKSKLVPFLVFCGRVFFTTRDYAEKYQELIFKGDISYWVRFGEFLGEPVICLVNRLARDADTFKSDVASWKKYKENYLKL